MIHRELTILSTDDPRPNIIRSRPSLFLLTGPVNCGKTRTLRRWLCDWEAEGVSLGGIVSDALWNFNSKIGYDVCDLVSGKCWPIIRSTTFTCDIQIGKYHFDATKIQEVVHAARATPECDLLALDEIGPLELEQHGGFHDLLNSYLLERNCSLCFVVRDTSIDTFLDHYQFILKRGRML